MLMSSMSKRSLTRSSTSSSVKSDPFEMTSQLSPRSRPLTLLMIAIVVSRRSIGSPPPRSLHSCTPASSPSSTIRIQTSLPISSSSLNRPSRRATEFGQAKQPRLHRFVGMMIIFTGSWASPFIQRYRRSSFWLYWGLSYRMSFSSPSPCSGPGGLSSFLLK